MTVNTKPAIVNLVNDMPLLETGVTSLGVAILQQLLITEGYGANLAITGYFGDETYAAVLNFQQAVGLVQDGVVGVNTWNNLAQPLQSAPTGN